MSNRNLIVLGIVAVMSVALAVMQSQAGHSRAKRPQRKTFEDSFLLQGLNLTAIASMRIGTGGEPLTLTRRGGQFVIVTKDDYPADTEKINDLLVSLADLRVSELITSNPENHADLHVTEQDADSLIQFFDRDGALITGVVIGARHVVDGGSGPAQRYARLLSSQDVYLADSVPSISDSALEYMNKELVTTTVEDIDRIIVSRPESRYTLKAAPAGEQPAYLLAPLPEGRTVEESRARSLFSAFTSVAFEDVRKDDAFADRLQPVGAVVCQLRSQAAYTFELLKGEEATYARVRAEYLDSQPIFKENRIETDDELKAKEARLLARDHAEDFSATHGGWLYKLPQWKADSLVKTPEDLLQEVEEASSPESPEPLPAE